MTGQASMSASLTGDDKVILDLTGDAGKTYGIEKSSNLATWTAFETIAAIHPTGNKLELSKEETPVFYRAKELLQSGPSISQGFATTLIDTLLNCTGGRMSPIGLSTASDGTKWTVPAVTQFQSGPYASDLYNECSGVTLANIDALSIEDVPIVEVDADGEVITGYLFADNYFELYVNGVLIAVDPVPFTPFNSSVVRFKATHPITYAVKLVDWEENSGLGSEENRGNAYHAGDGGFVANFSDGTRTNGDWKAQSFYISPLEDPAIVIEQEDGTHDSSNASLTPTCEDNCYALHYPVPANWFSPEFDDSLWPDATTYTNETVGVDNKPSYTNFSDQFIGSGAVFIWSSNLVLDNEVIVRYTKN
jgi:hypothetical protein